MLFSWMTWWPHCASISSLAGCWPKCLMRDMHSPYTYKACKWAADPHLFPQALIFFSFLSFSVMQFYHFKLQRSMVEKVHLNPQASNFSDFLPFHHGIVHLSLQGCGIKPAPLLLENRISPPFLHVIMQSKPSRVQYRANSSLPWSLSTFSALYIL